MEFALAFELSVDNLERDGTIRVRHLFYGETIAECERLRDAHAAGCAALGPALDLGHVIETLEEIEELPELEDD